MTAPATPPTAPTSRPGPTASSTSADTVRQADVDAGLIANSASASAPGAAPETTSASVPVAQAPGLALEKAITAGDPFSVLDQPIAYEYTVTNSGDVTLGGTLAVADDRVTVDCDPASVAASPPASPRAAARATA